jgi:hypothetical protein
MVPQQGLETSAAEIARSAAGLFREDRMPASMAAWYSDGSLWQSRFGCESLNQADWETAVAGTLNAGFARARQRGHLAGVIILFSDGHSIQYGPPPAAWTAARGADSLSHCKRDITRVLYETGHCLTTRPILQALEARSLLWGESTVKRALAEMVRDGELTNRSDVRPRGYGLPAWD